MKKDVMISLRLTPNQYITLLETLVKEKKSKSQFIRESINRSLFRINDKSCRKKEIVPPAAEGLVPPPPNSDVMPEPIPAAP
jgi:Arc/MetJ-type ribon-helix-helix transcriptional regulator